MEPLKCDICGGKLKMQSGGNAVCENCGMEYTNERLKEKVQEIKGSVTIEGRVQVDSSHLNDNYVNLIESSLKQSNYTTAEHYCDKVLESDYSNYKVWMYKGTAVSWQSTMANLRAIEGIDCYKKAFELCPEDEKEAILSYCDSSFKSIVFALFDLIGGFINKGYSDSSAKTFINNNKMLYLLLQKYKLTVNPDFPAKDLFSQGMKKSGAACVASAKADEARFHKFKPTSEDGNMSYHKDVIASSTLCAQLVDNIPEMSSNAKADLCEYAADIVNIAATLGFYVWFDGSACHRYNNSSHYLDIAANYRDKAAQFRVLGQEEYWKEHPEEYAAYKESLAKAEKEKKEEEEKKKKAFDSFWNTHYKESEEIKKEAAHLNALIPSVSGRKVKQLIYNRIHALNEVLNAVRLTSDDFTKQEKDVLNGKDQFEKELAYIQAKRKRTIVLSIAILTVIVFAVVAILILQNKSDNTPYEELKNALDNGTFSANWRTSKGEDLFKWTTSSEKASAIIKDKLNEYQAKNDPVGALSTLTALMEYDRKIEINNSFVSSDFINWIKDCAYRNGTNTKKYPYQEDEEYTLLGYNIKWNPRMLINQFYLYVPSKDDWFIVVDYYC